MIEQVEPEKEQDIVVPLHQTKLSDIRKQLLQLTEQYITVAITISHPICCVFTYKLSTIRFYPIAILCL